MNWQILDSTYPFSCPWLKVRKDYVRLRDGLEVPDFYVIEAPDWVNVIAITTDGMFIVEEQYRHGIQQVCFELCAGIVEEGETPIAAAKRELREETGYSGGNWSYLGMSVPNASGATNKCYHFVANGVTYEQKPELERTEDIKIHLLSEQDLKQLIHDDRIAEAVMQVPLCRYFGNK